MDGPRRSRCTIEVTIETEGISPGEHEKRARWLYRNMLSANADLQEVFYVAAVRDENGQLLEFQGAGRRKPSDDVQQILEELMREKNS